MGDGTRFIALDRVVDDWQELRMTQKTVGFPEQSNGVRAARNVISASTKSVSTIITLHIIDFLKSVRDQ